jgi:hypothetical protein
MDNNYQKLLSDCREIIVEFGFTHRWALIELYWSLGKRINSEENVTVTQLAEDLGKNVRTIQRAVQFHKMYPDLNMLPEGKNTSWHQIVNKYLPEPKENEKEKTPEIKKETIECPQCHYRWEHDRH